ncbi:hypothetical protein C8F04DRAFT_1186420 [Mycena alexandri]|uniref:Uncharacterized protein n=1 Tax=Mycena alexandri TaxID=1745969 RepID=A0AAD6SMP0_9AGAR|nr:hypothetical protein C8F04DRAFT_1186420 [Mycena alexandri]
MIEINHLRLRKWPDHRNRSLLLLQTFQVSYTSPFNLDSNFFELPLLHHFNLVHFSFNSKLLWHHPCSIPASAEKTSERSDQSVTLVNKYPVWVWLDAPLQAINGATQATCGGMPELTALIGLNVNKDDEQVALYTDKGDVWTGKHINKAGIQSQSTTDKHAPREVATASAAESRLPQTKQGLNPYLPVLKAEGCHTHVRWMCRGHAFKAHEGHVPGSLPPTIGPNLTYGRPRVKRESSQTNLVIAWARKTSVDQIERRQWLVLMREDSTVTCHNIHASVPKLVDNVGDMFSDELSGGGGLKDTKPELSHLGEESILQESHEVEVGLKTCNLPKEQIECGGNIVKIHDRPGEDRQYRGSNCIGCEEAEPNADSKMRKTRGEAKGGAVLGAMMDRPEDFGRVESGGQQAEQGVMAGLRVEEELAEKQSELDSGLQAEEPAQERQQLAVLGHCLRGIA